MEYEEWEGAVPAPMREDALWEVPAYRLALYAADLALEDAARLGTDPAEEALGARLHLAVAAIGAAVCRAYGFPHPFDRLRRLEAARRAVRRGRHWYVAGRAPLGDAAAARVALLDQIDRLLRDAIAVEALLFDAECASWADGEP